MTPALLPLPEAPIANAIAQRPQRPRWWRRSLSLVFLPALLVALLVSHLGESLRTARHRLEEETERARQFVALTDQVVQSVTAGILAADLEGRVLHVNPTGARILDLADAEAVVGEPLDEVMPLANDLRYQ